MDNVYIKNGIGEYLIPKIDDYLFDELSDAYMNKAGIKDILKGVPIPVKKTELTGLSTLAIAKNMAFVVGADPAFAYLDNYLSYIERTFSKEFAKPLINEGVEFASGDDFEQACIYFRAAILIDPEDVRDALYCYGRACKDAYERSEEERYTGLFKAESLDAFEKLTMAAPEFDMGFYFLGFAYLNLGLYIKSKLTFDTFLKLTEDVSLKEEVTGLQRKLEEPCRIEEGYNAVLSGRFETGIDILSVYKEDERFNGWWPLWYYLAVAAKALDDNEVAAEYYKRVLSLSPSNAEAMEGLSEICYESGDEEGYEKYKKKAEIVRKNARLDREERRAAEMPGLS